MGFLFFLMVILVLALGFLFTWGLLNDIRTVIIICIVETLMALMIAGIVAQWVEYSVQAMLIQKGLI